MNKDIAILLATYNSERYLSALLDSLFAQTFTEWTLHIRDDGSTDRTLAIIAAYKKQHENITLHDDPVLGKGAKRSFMWLLSVSNANYYMFCDHDDIWLPKKVETTLNRMEQLERQHPGLAVIVHTDLIVVDEQLSPLSTSFWRYSGIHPKFSSFDFYSAYNNITGCTMMINSRAKVYAVDMPMFAPMHDLWLAMVVTHHSGIVDFIEEPLILYRQHSRNVIGAKENPSILSRLMVFRKVIQANKLLLTTVRHFRKTSLLSFLINKITHKYKLLKNRY
jgi:glycosyltransferase involved in cell wall biosynthesis